MLERCDYDSDEDFNLAVAMEEEDSLNRMFEEDFFDKFEENEFEDRAIDDTKCVNDEER